MPSRLAVIYARYSSASQREESIEDQVRECHAWASTHDVTILHVYADHAISGRSDDRPEFQRMIADAERGMFDAIVMYKMDRFSRNRYDAAVYKRRLKKCGIALHYAKESIPDGPEGIILESLMEGLAEYYSANLAQNIKRGIEGNARKAIAMNPAPLGLRINADRMYEPDPITAPHVLTAYQMAADGSTFKSIADYLNGIGLRTSKGSLFNKNSFQTMLTNRKYIGEYRHGGVTIQNAITPIIPEDLFQRVQDVMQRKHTSRGGQGKAMVDYLLSMKLYCGHCGSLMTGETGTSKTGTAHHYYHCSCRKRKHQCNKTPERKEPVERWIVQQVVDYVLQPDILSNVIDKMMEIYHKELAEDTVLASIEAQLGTVQTSLRNLMRAIEAGIITQSTQSRLLELEAQRDELQAAKSARQRSRPVITRDQVEYFMSTFRDGDVSDPDYQRRVIDALVHRVDISDADPDDNGPRRRVRLTLNLTERGIVELDASSADVFGCSLDSSTTLFRHRICRVRWR